MAVALHLDDIVERFRKTAVPALFARREQKERVDAKVRPFKVEGNYILGLYDFSNSTRNMLIYSEVELPLEHPIVWELREKFARFHHGTFSGDFTLSEAGLLNILGQNLAVLEGEITLGNAKYNTKFIADRFGAPAFSADHLYLTEIRRE